MDKKERVFISLTFDELQTSIIDCVNLCLQGYKPTHPPALTPKRFLTVKQAADFLHLTKPTVYSKVCKGELPAMKRGNRLYFSQDELEAYLKAGSKKTNADIEAEARGYLSGKKKG